MKRALYIASGISVIITTLAFGYTMYRNMAHLVVHHGQGFSNPLFAMHTIFAVAALLLSLTGAWFLLNGWRQHQN